jgi:hypothetical protein
LFGIEKEIEILVSFDNFMEEKSIVALEVYFLSDFFSFNNIRIYLFI